MKQNGIDCENVAGRPRQALLTMESIASEFETNTYLPKDSEWFTSTQT
jgi:hypothetical protein